MLLELFFDFGLWIFEYILEFIPALEPALLDLTSLFAQLLRYGIWVIGDDMWLTILTNVSAWFTVKLTVGIVLFCYHQIPFNH